MGSVIRPKTLNPEPLDPATLKLLMILMLFGPGFFWGLGFRVQGSRSRGVGGKHQGLFIQRLPGVVTWLWLLNATCRHAYRQMARQIDR